MDEARLFFAQIMATLVMFGHELSLACLWLLYTSATSSFFSMLWNANR
jgi:hypothetical protein